MTYRPALRMNTVRTQRRRNLLNEIRAHNLLRASLLCGINVHYLDVRTDTDTVQHTDKVNIGFYIRPRWSRDLKTPRNFVNQFWAVSMPSYMSELNPSHKNVKLRSHKVASTSGGWWNWGLSYFENFYPYLIKTWKVGLERVVKKLKIISANRDKK